MSKTATAARLQVWWIPQVPMKPFTREVSTLREAKVLLETLADYDIFQFENNIKPDYSNAGGLSVWNESDSNWECWETEDGQSIDDIELSEL